MTRSDWPHDNQSVLEAAMIGWYKEDGQPLKPIAEGMEAGFSERLWLSGVVPPSARCWKVAWRRVRIGALAEDRRQATLTTNSRGTRAVAGATGASGTEGVACRATRIGCEAEG